MREPPPLGDEPRPAAGWLAIWLATWLHIGRLPFAPGTFGSIAALPLAWGLAVLGGPLLLIAASFLLFPIGIWAARRYMEELGVHDPGSVVIDEVAGQCLTLAAAPLTPLGFLLGLIAFRIFDILKPWPVNWLDRNAKGGFGVMIDDMAAGVYAGLSLLLIVWLLDL